MQKANLSRIPFDVGRLMSAHTLKLYCNMFYEKADAKLARSIPIASQESVYIHKSATHTHTHKRGARAMHREIFEKGLCQRKLLIIK